MSEAQEWAPAFEGQRPPFAPGNEMALKHGIKSPRKVDPRAELILAEALEDPSLAYLQQPRFAAALLAWAKAEARVQLIEEWIEGMSMEEASHSGQGKTSPLELLRKWETTASGHRSRLGLDPASAARLGKDIAQGRQADAAAALTQMREAYERSMKAEEAPDE